MEHSLLKSDVFFFVATIALILITLLMTVGLLYILSILRTIREISKAAKVGAEAVVESLQEVKNNFSSASSTAFFTSLFKKFYSKKKK